jgi:hypothetical protein
VKKESDHRRDTRECSRSKRAWPTWTDSLAVWGLLVWPSSAALPLAFAYAFIYIKKGVTYEEEAIRETERRQIRDHRFRDQINLGFLPRGGDRRSSSPPSSPPSSPIDHVIVLVVWDLRGLSWRYSCIVSMRFIHS